MHTTIFEMINELYKAFISDLVNTDETKAASVRKRLNRLSKEEGSLEKSINDFYFEFKTYVDEEFHDDALTQSLYEFMIEVKYLYLNKVWNEFNYYDSVEEDKAHFWKILTDKYYSSTFHNDIGNKYNPNDNSFFFCIYDSMLKKMGISSYEQTDEIFQYIDPRNIKKWKAGETLPCSYLALKHDLENLFSQRDIETKKINDFNYYIFFSLGISRLRNLSKKVLVYKPQNIDVEIKDYERLLVRLIHFPSDTCNKRRYQDCGNKQEDNDTLETLRLFFCGLYHYFVSDFKVAQDFLLKAFELGRYHIGPWVKYLNLYLLHSCRMNTDRKTFKRVFNWYHFVGNNNFTETDLKIDNFEEQWRILGNEHKPAQVYIDGKLTIYEEAANG